jgi:hypothetical protein
MSQNERERNDSIFDDSAIMGLLVAAGAGLVLGTVFGKRAIKRTLKIVIIRILAKRILSKIT